MKVSIIGQGYVGLTVSFFAAKVGHQVIGLESNKSLINDLKKGLVEIPGIDAKTLIKIQNEGRLLLTSNPESLSETDVVIIAVPTPLDEYREPDLSYLEKATSDIARYASPNTLIINESTSYPGTLRNFIMHNIENKTSLNLLYASAPERVDPGNQNWNIRNTPRILSGITSEATARAYEFYSTFCDDVRIVESPEIAESAKIFENTFRQVNIALSNEFSNIASEMGFSAHKSILAASTKPFGFMPFFPSIGVGGHCIPVDPNYLVYVAKNLGINLELIKNANTINLLTPQRIVKKIEKFLGKPIKSLSVQIAGISYKPGVSDMRESPTIQLIEQLLIYGAKVTWHDPLVKIFEGVESSPLTTSIDLGLIVTPHSQIDFSIWKTSNLKVLDLSPDTNNYGWPKFL
jgi:UDP-N-acetyl-D-glucosamine dehydrogenase